ncbi:AMP-binding protein, partial [Streptomyces spectabilis]|uniref:AMP-binding protein n=1 Tax=Streptomyces spectabilis TaxID=68270 RepID=UPI00340AED62
MAERMTAADLEESSRNLALALQEVGIRPGDLVGLLAPVGASFLSSFFAIQRIGAACSVLPTQTLADTEESSTLRLLSFIDGG